MKRGILIFIPVFLLAGLFFVRHWQNPDANTWLQRQASRSNELRIEVYNWNDRIGLSQEEGIRKAIVIADKSKIQRLIQLLNCSGSLSDTNQRELAEYDRDVNAVEGKIQSVSIHFNTEPTESVEVQKVSRQLWIIRTSGVISSNSNETLRLAEIESDSVSRFLNELRKIVQESRTNPNSKIKIWRGDAGN